MHDPIIYKPCPTPNTLIFTANSCFTQHPVFSTTFMSTDEEFFNLDRSGANTDGAGTEESDVDASDHEHVRAILHVPPLDADIGVVQQVSNVCSWYYELAMKYSPANRPFWRFKRHIQSKGKNCRQSGGRFPPPKGLPAVKVVLSSVRTPILLRVGFNIKARNIWCSIDFRFWRPFSCLLHGQILTRAALCIGHHPKGKLMVLGLKSMECSLKSYTRQQRPLQPFLHWYVLLSCPSLCFITYQLHLY